MWPVFSLLFKNIHNVARLLLDIHFEFNPRAFPTDRSKVAFMISHLTGRAKTWAAAEWGRGSPVCLSLADFQAALTRTSVARLGGFPPNWATFDFISRGKNALGGYIHFGLLLPISGGFLIM